MHEERPQVVGDFFGLINASFVMRRAGWTAWIVNRPDTKIGHRKRQDKPVGGGSEAPSCCDQEDYQAVTNDGDNS